MSMKFKAIYFLVLALIAAQAIAKNNFGSSGGSHSVSGHIKKDGTYVPPHHATNPNNTQRDNWTTKPNVNPYTGTQGKKELQK